MLGPTVYLTILYSVSALAFLLGKTDERLAALICIAGTYATKLVYPPADPYSSFETGIFIVDGAALAAFTYIALRSNRYWPLWAASLQLTMILSHGLKALYPELPPRTYAAAERFWIYPTFLVLVVGTWRTYRRHRQAARLIAATLPPGGSTYQRLIHQSPYIDRIAPTGQQRGAIRTSIRHADRAGEASPSGYLTEQSPVGSGSPLHLPFTTRSHPSNEMSAGRRLLWIVLITMGTTSSTGIYLVGLESFSRTIGG